MNNQFGARIVALAISGLAFSPPVLAEDITCGDIHWKPQILERCAGINDACQEVVVRDGKNFVRFEVKIVRTRTDGNVTVLMRLRDGSRVEGTFFAPRDFEVLSKSGQTTFRINELSPGDVLDVYIPQSRIDSESPGEGSA